MEFITEAQKACCEKIAPWLKDLFKDASVPYDQVPVFVIPLGSAVAMVEVVPWKEDALIKTWSYVVTGVELTPDLMHFLLRKNVEMDFGAFGVDEDGDIRFEHTIVASTCDPEELQASVAAVLEAADHYDDEIVNQWGGRRAVDRRVLGRF